jgi:hypothetical protein
MHMMDIHTNLHRNQLIFKHARQSRQTDVKQDTLNPQWGEHFVFRLRSTDASIVFELFDHDEYTQVM